LEGKITIVAEAIRDARTGEAGALLLYGRMIRHA
jgi:hypothetical protein